MLHYSLFPSINHKVKPKFTSSLLNIHFLKIYSEQTLPLNLRPKNDIKIDMALYDVLVAESIHWEEITSFLYEKKPKCPHAAPRL